MRRATSSGASVPNRALDNEPAGGVEAPLYYVLSRTFPPEDIPKLERIFAVTPILGCLITQAADSLLAQKLDFAESITLVAKHEQWVKKLFDQYHLPALVIGEADGLEAVYPDGRKEKVIL